MCAGSCVCEGIGAVVCVCRRQMCVSVYEAVTCVCRRSLCVGGSCVCGSYLCVGGSCVSGCRRQFWV